MNELLEMSIKEIEHSDDLIPTDNIIYSFYCIISNPSPNSITMEFDKSRIELVNQSYRINNLQTGNFGRVWVRFSANLNHVNLLAFSEIDFEDINRIKVIQ